jgi:hypothetical protein
MFSIFIIPSSLLVPNGGGKFREILTFFFGTGKFLGMFFLNFYLCNNILSGKPCNNKLKHIKSATKNQ